jgi:hypothetical protein
VKEGLHELADRIRGTVLDLDRVTDRAMRSWSHAQKALQDRDVYLDSAALNIHGFYSGLERIFEIIAREVDGALPTGQVWHRDLLFQMSRDMPDVRPGEIELDNLNLERLRETVKPFPKTTREPKHHSVLCLEVISLSLCGGPPSSVQWR